MIWRKRTLLFVLPKRFEMTECLVSICIPTYNQVISLKRCLDSIIEQSFVDYEIIITDDTRTNNVKIFIENYNFLNKPYLYKQNNIQLGSPANWNEAIKLAKGKYIKVLHHDDWFTYPNSLQEFVNCLENNPQASIGFVSSRNINLETFEIINMNTPTDINILKIEKKPILLVCGNQIGSPSATIFRKYNMQYFDENLVWYVDTECYTNILTNQKNILSFCPLDAISNGVSNLQISRKCENDVKINIYEFFYYLNKYQIANLKEKEIFDAALMHIFKFNLKSILDIKILYEGVLPSGLNIIFILKKYFGENISFKILKNQSINKIIRFLI